MEQLPSSSTSTTRLAAEHVVRTIMFTDVIGSTSYADENGDDSYALLLDEHDRIVRAAALVAGGQFVKTTGDGAMLAFEDAASAITAAIDLQRRSIMAQIPLRVGADHGLIVECPGGDYRGLVANIAARLTMLADAGEVKVTDRVARAARLVGRTRPCSIRGVHTRQRVRTLTVRKEF
jgi:class 3 adenylate cyclase